MRWIFYCLSMLFCVFIGWWWTPLSFQLHLIEVLLYLQFVDLVFCQSFFHRLTGFDLRGFWSYWFVSFDSISYVVVLFIAATLHLSSGISNDECPCICVQDTLFLIVRSPFRELINSYDRIWTPSLNPICEILTFRTIRVIDNCYGLVSKVDMANPLVPFHTNCFNISLAILKTAERLSPTSKLWRRKVLTCFFYKRCEAQRSVWLA